MRICILVGSPNEAGNTETLLLPIKERLKNLNVEVNSIRLYDQSICPCLGCYTCQDNTDTYNCIYDDDMQDIVDVITKSDFVLFATPIHSWFCTAPMKALIDRLLGTCNYCLNGDGSSLWARQKVGLLVTYGGNDNDSYDLFEEALKRICGFYSLDYIGSYCVRDVNGIEDFTSRKAVNGAIEFANKIYNSICVDSKIIKLDPFNN